jgi:SAM-dependent methyltransferase
MTSDHRILPGKLNKVSCSGCGLITNDVDFTRKEIETFYEDEYQLNTKDREEHIYFTKDGPVARSEAFANWLAPYVGNNTKRILEVGCGEGLFLNKLRKKLPEMVYSGIDGSFRAVELAKLKGLSVSQQMILDGSEQVEKSNVIILNGVVEHIQNLPSLFKFLKSSITHNGTVIFTLPILDEHSYDQFLYDHVWHFTSDKFIELLQTNGFKVLRHELNHEIIHGFGLYVCKLDEAIEVEKGLEKLQYLDTMYRAQIHWTGLFSRLEEKLNSLNVTKVAVFGAGEVFSLLMAYSKLSEYTICSCIDETPSLEGTAKHGIEIHDINWLEESNMDTVVLAVNPIYTDIITEKLSHIDINIIPIE